MIESYVYTLAAWTLFWFITLVIVAAFAFLYLIALIKDVNTEIDLLKKRLP